MRPIGVLLIALVLAAGAAAATAASQDPVEVPVILSLTGNGAYVGGGELLGVRGVEAEINKTGGIGGRPLHFAVGDDESSPQVAVQLFNAAMVKKPSVLLGPSIAAACNAIAPLVTQGPVHYCLSTGIQVQPGSYTFSTITSVRDHLQAVIRYFRQRGLRRVAIVASTDASGRDGEVSLDKVLALPENASMTLVAREHFNIPDLTVAAQMARVKAAKPQLFVAEAIGPASATLFKGVTEADLNIPVIGSAATLVYQQMKQYAAFLPKELYFAGCNVYAQDEVRDGALKRALLAFDDEVRAQGGRPELLQVAGWDPAMIVATVLRKLGPEATPERFRTALNTLAGYPGAYGRYDFRQNPQRGVGPPNVVVVRWVPEKDNWVGVSKPGGDPL